MYGNERCAVVLGTKPKRSYVIVLCFRLFFFFFCCCCLAKRLMRCRRDEKDTCRPSKSNNIKPVDGNALNGKHVVEVCIVPVYHFGSVSTKTSSSMGSMAVAFHFRPPCSPLFWRSPLLRLPFCRKSEAVVSSTHTKRIASDDTPSGNAMACVREPPVYSVGRCLVFLSGLAC